MKYLTVLALISTPAFAYTDGTFHCKNSSAGENTYKIETISLGSLRVPLVEATLRYPQNPEVPNSPIMESKVSGVAVLAVQGENELLALGTLKFEFVKGALSHCKQ